MIRDQFLSRYIGKLKSQMDELAHGAMNMPLKDLFEHGVIVGHYRGLQEALQLLEAEIEDDAEKDKEK